MSRNHAFFNQRKHEKSATRKLPKNEKKKVEKERKFCNWKFEDEKFENLVVSTNCFFQPALQVVTKKNDIVEHNFEAFTRNKTSNRRLFHFSNAPNYLRSNIRLLPGKIIFLFLEKKLFSERFMIKQEFWKALFHFSQ